MLQPKRVHRIRRSLCRFTQKATLYVSWVLGLFPFTFDPRKRQLHRSKWLLAYGLILNTSLLALSLLPYTDDHNSVKMEIYERNPLVKQVEQLVEGISLLPPCYVVHKALVVVLEVGSSLVLYFGMPDSKAVVQEALCIYIVQLEILLVVMHFHLAVIYIYRCLWIINGQLLEMISRLRRGKDVDPGKIQLLLGLYGRILDLNNRLASIYDIQITLFMATLFSANIIVGHLYGLIANYSLLDLLVFMDSKSLKLHKLEVFKQSPLLEMLSMVIGVMNVFSAAVIHFMNFWGCKRVQEIGNELIALEYLNRRLIKCYDYQTVLMVMMMMISQHHR
ncbi:hypothetical protein M5D96_004777 [Drosophila gunungcola]|uniref:Gustatory receptor n=1 Tax=Drosophila gunungcola TaxID=103775 RepID=A0A9Q0BTL1_9MUSC|nr:hypothetical protein M5D96_004777 [Drosophila gunungcola]